MAITSIQLSEETRALLAGLKSSPRETYDDLLRKLISLVPEGDDEGRYSDAFRVGLLNAHLDAKHGRTISQDEVKRRLGLA